MHVAALGHQTGRGICEVCYRIQKTQNLSLDAVHISAITKYNLGMRLVYIITCDFDW